MSIMAGIRNANFERSRLGQPANPKRIALRPTHLRTHRRRQRAAGRRVQREPGTGRGRSDDGDRRRGLQLRLLHAPIHTATSRRELLLRRVPDPGDGRHPTGKARRASEAADQQPVLEFSTVAGSVKIVGTPAGVTRGFDALRTCVTIEHLGDGLRPSIASTTDLITMAAACGLAKDIALVPELQRILQLEASPARIVETPAPGNELPGSTLEPPGREL